ncbi:pyridoxal-phosphate dependent enzyme [Oceanihabitans sediminis]|uniref:Pyridoxal-phosphate dependent enzyme n=1 Tax=Oceanihabitans sediminis TaxID=1812012 RepID=A0A368P3D2_9FLAO|nr:pyridoxal-phosphate dependent enzyme [Oceanihabitans sediminis]MDX1277250.1 pyridoxal-phosphate dependent enzyme [Oceanihabitans sediminis]RBP33113.1 threonine dehydratase [Oceanihabitans sediminis]RCU57377.1 pyridoxal-phosphate dependent enzyme [Oceanihabitans sediminis]
MQHKEAILSSYKRITPYIHNTPVLTSEGLNAIAGANLYFKCENFQKMGAFKMRGALNAVLQLSDVQKSRGVVTHSSGNFAQAVSLAAKQIGISAHIVMPENAPQVKKDAVLAYGGKITLCASTIEAREVATENIIKEIGATFIHPSNDLDVIYGNATACYELIEEHDYLDFIVAPVGGGGLLAGTALSASLFGRNCKAFGGEPIEVNDAYRSLKSGKIESNNTTNTIADGLRTQLGDINFPIIREFVEEIVCVEEVEILEAMKLIYQRLKIVVEPSSAVALAAVLKNKKHFSNKSIGIIISGGNVDLKSLPF